MTPTSAVPMSTSWQFDWHWKCTIKYKHYLMSNNVYDYFNIFYINSVMFWVPIISSNYERYELINDNRDRLKVKKYISR